jgi:PAS domain S-box-containing protein
MWRLNTMPAKELLKDRDKQFRLLFEDHPQPMWVVDAGSGRFLAANAAAEQLYQYSADQFRNMSTGDIEVEEQSGVDKPLTPRASKSGGTAPATDA